MNNYIKIDRRKLDDFEFTKKPKRRKYSKNPSEQIEKQKDRKQWENLVVRAKRLLAKNPNGLSLHQMAEKLGTYPTNLAKRLKYAQGIVYGRTTRTYYYDQSGFSKQFEE